MADGRIRARAKARVKVKAEANARARAEARANARARARAVTGLGLGARADARARAGRLRLGLKLMTGARIKVWEPHRTASHRTAPHRTAPHHTKPYGFRPASTNPQTKPSCRASAPLPQTLQQSQVPSTPLSEHRESNPQHARRVGRLENAESLDPSPRGLPYRGQSFPPHRTPHTAHRNDNTFEIHHQGVTPTL